LEHEQPIPDYWFSELLFCHKMAHLGLEADCFDCICSESLLKSLGRVHFLIGIHSSSSKIRDSRVEEISGLKNVHHPDISHMEVEFLDAFKGTKGCASSTSISGMFEQ
jgi:hypothetical protein